MSEFVGKHILIIIEDLPVPFDTRMWQQAKALKEFGAEVSIICPKMKGLVKEHEIIDGINIYRHNLKVNDKGVKGYIVEYSMALYWQLKLASKIHRHKRIDVIHGCSPPDLIFLTAMPFKLFGTKYVFDHHDVSPELFEIKFGRTGLFYNLLILMERLTFRTANFSIATNESYKQIAIKRGRMNPDRVRVVRSGPDLDRLHLVNPNEIHKAGKDVLISYIGNIGNQEGIDILLEAASIIKKKGYSVQYAIMGSGTFLDEAKKIAKSLNVIDIVKFYGRVTDEEMREVFSTSDIAVNPDKPSDMNNISTMNKIMEYMTMELPIVQFSMLEGKRSAKDASLYAEFTSEDFAEKLIDLIDNQKKRKLMGKYGRQRVEKELNWEIQKRSLKTLYREVLAK